MSNLEDGPDLGDVGHVRAEEEREEQDKVMEQSARLAQASDTPHVPLARRIAERIRRAVSGGASPEPAEPKVSDEEVWDRELQRRQEYEQDREGEREHS